MATIQFKQLHSTDYITCDEQQQVHGGRIAEKLLNGYRNGSYFLQEVNSSLYKVVDSRGRQVGGIAFAGGYTYYIGDGYIEAAKGTSIDAVLNVNSAFLP